MTFELFYSIIRPLKAASFNTISRVRIIIVFIFIFGFTYSIPFLFISVNDGRTCIPNAIASNNILGELYYWLTEVVTFIFPFISLLCMNSVIIDTLRKRSKLTFSELTGQDQTEGQNVRIKSSEKQIFTMLLLVTFMFLILNFSVHLLIFYVNFYTGNTPYYFASLHLFYQFGEKVYAPNHGINFFLYVMSGQKLRTDLVNLFCAKKSKNIENIGKSTNTISTITSEI